MKNIKIGDEVEAIAKDFYNAKITGIIKSITGDLVRVGYFIVKKQDIKRIIRKA